MRRLLVVPSGSGVGLTSVCLGIVRALDQIGARYAFAKPISVMPGRVDRSNALIRLAGRLTPPQPIPRQSAETLLGRGDEAHLLERVVEVVQSAAEGTDADVVVVEGLVPVPEVAYATHTNIAMAKALDAELVLVAAAPASSDPATIAGQVDIAARAYGEVTGGGQRCCVLNRVEMPSAERHPSMIPGVMTASSSDQSIETLRAALASENLHPLGIIPNEPELGALRIKELARALDARVLNEGDWENRRMRRVALCAASIRYAHRELKPGTLLITPGDREDILLAAALCETSGAQLAGVLLTGGRDPEQGVLELCRRALESGLPLLSVNTDSYETAAAVEGTSRNVPADDPARAELVMRFIADHLDHDWLRQLVEADFTPRVTTSAFRHDLIERARAAKKTIVLPEGTEPRTVRAAAICGDRGIAQCVLLGDREKVDQLVQRDGIVLPPSVRVLDPITMAPDYVEPMVVLRSHKGMTAAMAANALGDTVVLGTMMLQRGEVDGLVSGAMHTTANTIRPALQLIKTQERGSLVSSIFFMCLPEQVLVYGDCAVNPNPTAEQLAEIALQSAASAEAFGIEPRVAMISYSTGASGAGGDVEKVARATEIAQDRRPDLLIDGPLQYDAAAVAAVGGQKAPTSLVAGRATVFIFPDLNTGNTTYKAVQRSAHVVSMGPMLQGLAKPVNDLSRGALVEDIVFTIALTAIQANA